MAAVLKNLEKFPNIDFNAEFVSLLMKEISKGVNGPDCWFLSNFDLVIDFFIKRNLITEDYLEILKCVFEVL